MGGEDKSREAGESSPAGGDIEVVIQGELLDLLYKSLPRGLVITVVNASLAAFVMRDQTTNAMLAAWLVIMLVVTAVRAAMTIHYRKHVGRLGLQPSTSRFRIGAAAAGMAWGSAAVLLLPHDQVAYQVFLGFVLAGMGAGAMASLSYDLRAYTAYVVTAVAPYAIALLWLGGELQIAMGTLALLFIAAMLQGGRTFQQSVTDMLRLRFENERIAAELRTKAEQEVAANRLLLKEIERTAAAEAAMRKAKEEADAASRAKSQFLANMSHEIRTPMNGVLGMTDLLMKSRLDERQRHLAGTLKSSGTMLLSIIDDILDLSRIEAGRFELAREVFDPEACIAGAIAILETQARQKDLALSLEVTGKLPYAVEGDPVRLRQVCVNLIGNAVKFTSSGSVRVTVAGEADGERRSRLRITVEDTGIGVEAEALERILKPFEQADASTSRRYGGTGLGLAICANLVSLMGGSLKIESEPGRGTRATFDVMTRVAETEAVQSDCDEAAQRFDGARVLVAEDNPVNQEIARTYLEELGCAVDVVDNGKAAVEACDGQRYDAVLMDCQMPELDGLEASVQIRALEAAAGLMRTPIVALTASAFQEDRDRCIAAGMDGHLSKPYSADQLAAALGAWVPRKLAANG